MEDYSFNIYPDIRMDVSERLLYNIYQELIKINKKLDNLKVENSKLSENKDDSKLTNTLTKSYPNNKNKKG